MVPSGVGVRFGNVASPLVLCDGHSGSARKDRRCARGWRYGGPSALVPHVLQQAVLAPIPGLGDLDEQVERLPQPTRAYDLWFRLKVAERPALVCGDVEALAVHRALSNYYE